MRVHEVKTSVLKLVYEEGGPKGGKPLLLVHGWPDSPRTWDGILPALHAAGYRTIAPYLRGFGPTQFRSPLLGRRPRRSGQPAAVAQDIIDLADALKLKQFDLVGHDWGARAAYAVAAVFPQRLGRLVTAATAFAPGPLKPPAAGSTQAQAYWYQWFLGTAVGEKAFHADPIAFARSQWDTWSPEGWYSASDFAEAAKSWANPDFADVTVHSYRVRWGGAEPDPAYAVLQARFEATPAIEVPTLLLQGLEDRVTLPETTDGMGRYFTNGYRRVLLEGVGHFVQREDPARTAAAILQHLSAT